jgi:hypothetical protein
MGSNIAQKRAAKAQRRKAIVADKRKAEIAATGGSLVERVRRATEGRIFRSAVQESLGRLGFGMVILVRESAAGELAMGGFLLDAHEGVKDAVFRPLGAVELDRFYEMVAETGAFGPIEPADARKLLHEAVARAQALGIRPHRDFTTVEAIYGDVRIEDSTGIPAVAGWGPDRLGAQAGEEGAPPAETGEPQEVGNAQPPPTDREP